MLKTRVLIADDHPVFLSGLHSLIIADPQAEVCAMAKNGAEALALIGKEQPEVSVLDISMPEMDGIAVVKQMREQKIPGKIILLTTFDDIEMIREAVKLKVDGYILKSSTGTELMTAISKVTAGEKYYSAEVKEAIANDFLNHAAKSHEGVLLTPRELEIVRLLADEMTNDEIAERLFISFRTVETHRKNIMHKTGAKNLAGLIRFASEAGILS